MRKLAIKILKTYLDYSYKIQDNKEMEDLQQQILNNQRKANLWQGEYAIMHKEVVKLNRACHKNARKAKRYREVLYNLKAEHPELFEQHPEREGDIRLSEAS